MVSRYVTNGSTTLGSGRCRIAGGGISPERSLRATFSQICACSGTSAKSRVCSDSPAVLSVSLWHATQYVRTKVALSRAGAGLGAGAREGARPDCFRNARSVEGAAAGCGAAVGIVGEDSVPIARWRPHATSASAKTAGVTHVNQGRTVLRSVIANYTGPAPGSAIDCIFVNLPCETSGPPVLNS